MPPMPKQPCSICGHVHTSDMAVTINRFDFRGPTVYRDSLNPAAPIRYTLEEAELDACIRQADLRNPLLWRYATRGYAYNDALNGQLGDHDAVARYDLYSVAARNLHFTRPTEETP